MKINIISCLLVLGCLEFDFCQSQWCNDGSTVLPELERRARNREADGVDGNEPFIDDFLLNEGWYCVSNAMGQFYMPDNSILPDFATCSTYYPIYIRDAHPDPENLTETPVTLTACHRSTFSECDVEYTIQVRRSNGEVQYYLVPTERNAGYCFDPSGVQNATVSPRPTGVDLGTVSVEPELRFRAEDAVFESKNYFPYLVFKCIFTEQPFFYTVDWYIDGTYYRQLGPSDNIADLELLESVLLADGKTLGLTLQCGVRASSDITGITTTANFSENFFAGIVVMTPTLYLPKTSKADIEFKPTVPIGCEYNDRFNFPCEIGLNMVDPDAYYECEQSIVIRNSRRCGADATALKSGDTWDPDTAFVITVQTSDFNFADQLTFNLHLKTDEHYGHRIWEGVETDPVQVTVTDSDRYKEKICYAYNDPHMRTFEKTSYSHHVIGEFILYRNSLYDIEIQEKTTRFKRSSRLTSICAVAVRAGKDVFMINVCGRISFIGFLSCEDGGILEVVEKNSNYYYVYTPTGTRISIYINSWSSFKWLNVHITASPKDFGNVRGLCGTLGEENEFVNSDSSISPSAISSFTESWRLQSQDSLFVSVVNPDKFDAWIDRNALFCVCEQTINPPTGALGTRNSTALCSPTQYMNCTFQNTVTERKCSLVTGRKKRGFGSMDLETEQLLQLMASPQAESVELHRKKRQLSVITEEIALENCTAIIMGSLVAQNYSDLLGSDDLQQSITECTTDVVAGNDIDLAYLMVVELNNQVLRLFEQDLEYVANNTDHVQYFRLNTCLNDCLGRGTCNIEGKCECFSPYFGADCRYDEADLIHVEYIDGGRTCDVASGDECRCFYIYTSQLVADFTCSITTRTLDHDWNIILSDQMTTAGDWYDAFSGMCCLPLNRKRRGATEVFATQFVIAVSNSGTNFGNGYVITIYDSTCRTATTDADNSTVIELKAGYCFLDGQCVTHGDEQLSDNCYRCVSTASTSNWTNVCESPEEQSEESVGMVIIISVVIVTVVILGGIVAFCVWRKICRKTTKRSPSVGDLQADPHVKGPLNELIDDFRPVTAYGSGPAKDQFSVARGLSSLSIHFDEDGYCSKNNKTTDKTSSFPW